MVSPLKLIRGFIGAIALGSSSYFGAVFLMLPFAPMAFAPHLFIIYRWWQDAVVSFWTAYAIFIMRMLHGVDIVTHGEIIDPNDTAIIILNHRTRLDWFYFWSPANTDGCLFDLKTALKRTLARVPGAGWAQQLGANLFLNRRAELDLPRMKNWITYLSS